MDDLHRASFWQELKAQLQLGQLVRGQVTHREPFGVFLDLGYAFPGLLRVPELPGDQKKCMEDYPQVGELVEARILHFDDTLRQIVLTQRASEDEIRNLYSGSPFKLD